MYRRQGPGCVSMILMAVIGGLAIVAILSVSGMINPLGNFLNEPTAKVNAPGPAIVQQLRARNEWITFSYQADQLIEAQKDGNFLQDLLFGDRLLLQARGEVAAGMDMSQLNDQDVIINGTSITMTLPPARIIYSRLDYCQTRIYDRQRGWLSKGDVNMESDARAYAEDSIVNAACESGILDRAAIEGRTNVSELLKAVGYTNVTVNASKVSDCKASALIAAPPVVQPNPTLPPAVPTVGTGAPPVSTVVIPTNTPNNGSLTGTAVPIKP